MLPTSVFYGEKCFCSLSFLEAKNFRRVFGSLKRLDLSQNNFIDLPSTLLQKLQKLTHLNISHNRININYFDGRSWPILTNINLRFFDLSYNLVSDLNMHLISGLPNLTDLYMDNNKVSFFMPAIFENSSKLKTLSLNNNKLSLMVYSYNKTTVRELNLFGNNFSFSNDVVPFLNGASLKILRIGRPGLIYYPSTFKSIRLHYLQLRNFSQRLLTLDVLRSQKDLIALEIDNGIMEHANVENKQYLSNITFSNLPQLKSFFVNQCGNIGFGVIRLKNVTNLKTVDIHKASFSKRTFGEFFRIEGKNSIKFINISRNWITRVSYEDFYPFSQLEMLDISYNRIAIIPYPNLFSSFHNLKSLNLSGNLLRYLPKNFLISSSILHLNISHNLVKYVSALWHVNLVNLQDVDLSSNMIRAIAEPSDRSFSRYFLQRNWWNCTCDLLHAFSSAQLDIYCEGLPEDCFKCTYPKKHSNKSLQDLIGHCDSLPPTQNAKPGNLTILVISSAVIGFVLLLLTLGLILTYKLL